MENKVYNHPYFGEFYYSIDIPEQFKNGEKVRPFALWCAVPR